MHICNNLDCDFKGEMKGSGDFKCPNCGWPMTDVTRPTAKPSMAPGASKSATRNAWVTRAPKGPVTYADGLCVACDNTGEHEHLPPLQQSEPTRRLCTLIALSCCGADVLKRDNRGYMIGVLECNGVLYAAMSGQSTLRGFQEQIQLISREVPELKQLRWVTEVPKRKTAGGAVIDATWAKEVRDRSPAGLFECAAPKLIHYVIHEVLQLPLRKSLPADLTWSMTEMWVGPSDGFHENGVIYESCTNCVQVLPMMLCGLQPIALVDKSGFTLVAGKQQKKDMRAGRPGDRKK